MYFTHTTASANKNSKYAGGKRVNWAYLAFWYIELQAVFERLQFTNYSRRIFIVYICVKQKNFFCKLILYFIFHILFNCILQFFDFVRSDILSYSMKGFVFLVFCISIFLQGYRELGISSYSRYNLSGINIKTVF